MEKIEVVAAVTERDGKFLVCKKNQNHEIIPGKWEFPGGRIEDGETHDLALKRELREELGGFEVDVNRFLGEYSHSYDGKNIIDLYAYLCFPKNEPRCMEHERIQWVDPRNLLFYNMAEIDMKVVKKVLVRENLVFTKFLKPFSNR